MKKQDRPTDSSRRTLISATGAGLLLGGLALQAGPLGRKAFAGETPTLRWGVVGTGGIANSMAGSIKRAPHAELAAVSSRSMDKAQAFAGKHGAKHSFDSWAEMIASDTVDAIYCATPTSVREEICVAAALGGKHVLGEKPFASLPSLQRITAACREQGVGFMDGTHFVHHPRSQQVTAQVSDLVGGVNSLASAFQFRITDTNNIRLRPDLEPMGAIGDAGWYNMKAISAYLPQWYAGEVELTGAATKAHREPVNNAVNRAAGILEFSDGSTSTWNCGFESGAVVQVARMSGPEGVVRIDDFISQRPRDMPADYQIFRRRDEEIIQVEAAMPASAQMFEDMALMVGDAAAFEASVRSSERAQELLDAIWAAV